MEGLWPVELGKNTKPQDVCLDVGDTSYIVQRRHMTLSRTNLYLGSCIVSGGSSSRSRSQSALNDTGITLDKIVTVFL